ncbi:hypothetical protein CRG98_026803 [Punica granatum]|uniref:Secreted protein n=1 Tax=Punica granatum TaxID=22663 RepID=A0A2I0J9Z4_PUNGR|nr:hypothetical protein CRG98_026803 [Punica granatum]
MAGRIIFNVMVIVVSLSGIACQDYGSVFLPPIWADPSVPHAASLAESPAGSPMPPILFEEILSVVPGGAVKVEEDFIFFPQHAYDGLVRGPAASTPSTRKFLKSAHH